MDDRIVKFISALRGGGVRVSLAESADAFRAVEELGIADREAFRLSLRATLVKEANDQGTFDELFPLFFDSSDAPPMLNMAQDLTPEEGQMLAEALKQFTEQLRRMIERLLRGEQLSQEEMERLGQMVGLNRADDLRQREWMRMAPGAQVQAMEALQSSRNSSRRWAMNKQRLDPDAPDSPRPTSRRCRSRCASSPGRKSAENMAEQRPNDQLEGCCSTGPFNAPSDRDMGLLRRKCAGWPRCCAAAWRSARSGRRPASSMRRPQAHPRT